MPAPYILYGAQQVAAATALALRNQARSGWALHNRGNQRRFYPKVARGAPRKSISKNNSRRAYGRRAGGRRRECLLGTHPEKKWKDTAISISPGAGGLVTTLAVVPQGATESDRTGRKAIITDVLVKGHIAFGATLGTTSTLTANRVRIMIVQDTQPNKALFASTVIHGSSADINSYMNLVQAKRFKILFNKVYTNNGSAGHGNGDTAQDYGGSFVPFNINIKCCIDMEFDEAVGTDGTVDEQTINSISFLTYEETSSPPTTVHGIQRIRFVE